MKPCQQFKESILRLFDNELDILKKKDVERHLKECPHCARFLARMRLLRSRLRELSQITASENFHILVRERIRRDMARKGRSVASTVIFTRRWIPALGLTVFVAIMGFWMLDNSTSPLDSPVQSVADRRFLPSIREGYNGQIQYVIDDYPNRISVSRQDEEPESKLTREDSLLLDKDLKLVRNRLTPVSF